MFPSEPAGEEHSGRVLGPHPGPRQPPIGASTSPPSSRSAALWPASLAAAAVSLRSVEPSGRDRARATLWRLLHAALFAALRSQAGRIAQVTNEDLEDLASQKALELLLRAEEGTWDPRERGDHEIAGYVAQVARHALVDLARRRGRECPGPEDPEAWAAVFIDSGAEPVRPEDRLAAREFVSALRECVAALAPRSRQAWLRRVFLERPSREIALVLALTPSHVDVVVQRARESLRRCMESKGHHDVGVRPGAFVELWWGFSDEIEESS